jgi:hypothetical protein
VSRHASDRTRIFGNRRSPDDPPAGRAESRGKTRVKQEKRPWIVRSRPRRQVCGIGGPHGIVELGNHGKSRVDTLRELRITPQVVPVSNVNEGINAVQQFSTSRRLTRPWPQRSPGVPPRMGREEPGLCGQAGLGTTLRRMLRTRYPPLRAG